MPEFESCIGMRFRRLSRLVSNMFNEALKHHGLDISLVNILFGISSRPGIIQADIGKFLVLERSTLSRDIKKLTQMNLIFGEKLDGKKSLSLNLTKQGKKMVKKLREDWTELQLKIEDQIGSDLERSLSLFEKALIEE